MANSMEFERAQLIAMGEAAKQFCEDQPIVVSETNLNEHTTLAMEGYKADGRLTILVGDRGQTVDLTALEAEVEADSSRH